MRKRWMWGTQWARQHRGACDMGAAGGIDIVAVCAMWVGEGWAGGIDVVECATAAGAGCGRV